jgi:hypothetical protein
VVAPLKAKCVRVVQHTRATQTENPITFFEDCGQAAFFA